MPKWRRHDLAEIAWACAELNIEIDSSARIARLLESQGPLRRDLHLADAVSWVSFRLGDYHHAREMLLAAMDHAMHRPAFGSGWNIFPLYHLYFILCRTNDNEIAEIVRNALFRHPVWGYVWERQEWGALAGDDIHLLIHKRLVESSDSTALYDSMAEPSTS